MLKKFSVLREKMYERMYKMVKDKKTLREMISEARRAGHDSFNIMNDPEALEGIKRVAKKRGDEKGVREIQDQIDRLKGHSKEEILEILKKEHQYYGANRLSVTALYDHEDVFDKLKSDSKEEITPCAWAVCRESDIIDDPEIHEKHKPLTLHLPIEHFNTSEEAIDKFLVLYPLEERGIDTYNRCGMCKYFNNRCINPDIYNGYMVYPNDIACKKYKYDNLEEDNGE